MRILILAAFQNELSAIFKAFPQLTEKTIAKRRCWVTKKDKHDLIFSLSGLGSTAAASTTTALCATLEPDLILVCGVAGGLKVGQQVGDLVLATKIIDADLHASTSYLQGTPYESCLIDPHTLEATSNEYKVQPLLLELAASLQLSGMSMGTIVSSNVFPAPKELFSEILQLGCSAIEMESVGVFKAAEYYSIPVLTIRAISNLLTTSGEDLGTEDDAIGMCSARLLQFIEHFLSKMPALEPVAALAQQQKIRALIEEYDLSPHPEGGWYRQTFKSTMMSAGGRVAGTSIIYLLAAGDFSAWHLLPQSDETWHFHGGDPLLLRVIDPNTAKLEELILGLENKLQLTIKAGHLFSAETTGKYSLTGCVVTPGFEYSDFKLLSRTEFLDSYPEHGHYAYLARDKPVVDVDAADAEYIL